jgi:hypothetical protein
VAPRPRVVRENQRAAPSGTAQSARSPGASNNGDLVSSTQTGKTLWVTAAPAGINAFPAIDGNTLLVGAGTTGLDKNPHFQLIAYSLP